MKKNTDFSAFVKHWFTEKVKISVFQKKDEQWINGTYVSIIKKLASVFFKKLDPQWSDYGIKKKESMTETPKK